MSKRSMQTAARQPHTESRGRLRFTYLIFIGSLLLMIVSIIFSAFTAHRSYEAQLPQQNIEQLIRDMRQFHQQAGHFPRDFRELDERLWQHVRRERITGDGKSLSSPSNNYHYTLHTVAPDSVCIWAVPTGARAGEAATHFWYVTPTRVERWMGAALTLEQVSVVKDVPSESQLALLAMTKQTSPSGARAPSRDGVFSIFSLLGF